MFTSQLIAGGTVRQRDIVRAFRVPLASPELFVQLQQQRIAALTYHHYPEGKDWDGGEFREQSVKVANGGTGG